MCGLVAMFGVQGRNADAAILRKMSAAVSHRGPDDEGYFVERHVGFGFRRLAILDLSANGHQPMTTADRRYTIVFNGEIYNYVEIRKELIGRGHHFRSTGDSEVLLHAYQEWGVSCLSRLNGMWAFLIFDAHTGKLFGSRDRFGIKPLFFWRGESACLLGSEIKAIRDSGLYRHRTNWKVAARFLIKGALEEGAETFYDGIVNVPPASWFEIAPDGRYAEGRFWTPPASSDSATPDMAARFAELFEDAMSIHSRSDVPLAVHLSGGLDSTSIICALSRLRDEHNPRQEIRALSYMAQEFDETPYIEETLQQTRAKLVRLSATPSELWNSLEEVLWFHDEPVHSMTALVSYALMRETAQQGIKVVLNGQGADETLAGYPSYFWIFWQELLCNSRIFAAINEMSMYVKARHERLRPLLAMQLKFFARAQLSKLRIYRRASLARRNDAFDETPWYTPGLREHVKHGPYVRFDVPLREVLTRSVFQDPLPLYLRIEDRNAMAWSVESRVPFLDYRLVDLALGADCQALMHGPYGKYLLREAMAGRIPESVRARVDKMGFPTPASQWLRNELFQPLCDLLHGHTLKQSGVLEWPQLQRDIDRFKRGEADVSAQLFRLAQFGLWLEGPKQSRLAPVYEVA